MDLHTHLRMEGSWRVMATADVGLRTLADRQLRVVLGTAARTVPGSSTRAPSFLGEEG